MYHFIVYTSIEGNLSEIIPVSLNNLQWKYEYKENKYIIDFGTNLFSWGSYIYITLVNDRQCNIEFKSKVPTTIIDWGDSNKKLKQLILELQKNEAF